jgi:hypothetical protein
MTIALLLSLVLIGLSEIDPVGLMAIPVLLTQKNPFVRALIFLAGSFVALVLMGVVYAQGFGGTLLRFETSRSWLTPSIETAAGGVLLCVAAVLFWRLKTKPLRLEKPSGTMRKRLGLGNAQLFIFATGMVIAQSTVDVVFIVVMIRIGHLHLSPVDLLTAIITYSLAALTLQFIIIIAYTLTPLERRRRMLATVRRLLAAHAHQAIVYVSLLLGSGLLINGVLTLVGAHHL